MFAEIRRSAIFLLLMLVLTTGIYPLVIWGIGQVAFPSQANGSLVRHDGRIVGSRLLGQPFSGSAYFHGRPSAVDYDAAASGGSNLAPTSKALVKSVAKRARMEQTLDGHSQPVPIDLVTASGSGLDPDISPAAAYYQAARVADARHLPLARVRKLITAHVQRPTYGLLGDPRVNVLDLNLALDGLGQPEASQ